MEVCQERNDRARGDGRTNLPEEKNDRARKDEQTCQNLCGFDSQNAIRELTYRACPAHKTALYTIFFFFFFSRRNEKKISCSTIPFLLYTPRAHRTPYHPERHTPYIYHIFPAPPRPTAPFPQATNPPQIRL